MDKQRLLELAGVVKESSDTIFYLGLVNGKNITSEWQVTSDINWAKKQAEMYSMHHDTDDIAVIEVLPGTKIGDGRNKIVHQIKAD